MVKHTNNVRGLTTIKPFIVNIISAIKKLTSGRVKAAGSNTRIQKKATYPKGTFSISCLKPNGLNISILLLITFLSFGASD